MLALSLEVGISTRGFLGCCYPRLSLSNLRFYIEEFLLSKLLCVDGEAGRSSNWGRRVQFILLVVTNGFHLVSPSGPKLYIIYFVLYDTDKKAIYYSLLYVVFNTQANNLMGYFNFF